MKPVRKLLVLSVLLILLPMYAEAAECSPIEKIPLRIANSGTFCLVRDLVTDISDGNAIRIEADNVTIDLQGFTLAGSEGLSTKVIGIFAESRKNIIVRNGSISGFLHGVFLDHAFVAANTRTSFGHVLEKLRFIDNRHMGARVEGSEVVIRNNQFIGTGPGEISKSTSALFISTSRSVTISNNIISRTRGTDRAVGIEIQVSADIEIKNNSIYQTISQDRIRGIHIDRSQNIALHENTLLNPDSPHLTGNFTTNPKFAINVDDSSNVICASNIITGFASNGLSNCTLRRNNYCPDPAACRDFPQ